MADPETIATAIRIGNPASWRGAKEAARDSGGRIDKVTDDEIVAAYQLLAKSDGIFVEPASAAALAGVIRSQNEGAIPAGSLVVATMTGHGLKDPDNAIENAGVEPVTLPADLDAVKAAIGM
jgi:threonine synthase